jgi:hypothetical protein
MSTAEAACVDVSLFTHNEDVNLQWEDENYLIELIEFPDQDYAVVIWKKSGDVEDLVCHGNTYGPGPCLRSALAAFRRAVKQLS